MDYKRSKDNVRRDTSMFYLHKVYKPDHIRTPFLQCCLDYAGPFKARMTKDRQMATLEGYTCVFIRMVTTVHFELVRGLTGRRGLYARIYSNI